MRRLVLEMREQNLSNMEIAERLGVGVATVVRLQNAENEHVDKREAWISARLDEMEARIRARVELIEEKIAPLLTDEEARIRFRMDCKALADDLVAELIW
jgi:predicted transcriptional regulator